MKPEDLEGNTIQNITKILFENDIIELDEEDLDPKRESNIVILKYKPTKDFTIIIDTYYIIDSIVEIYENLDFKYIRIYSDMSVKYLEFKDEKEFIDRIEVFQIKNWNLKNKIT